MTIPSYSLEGKVAIVSGGRRGVGRAIALTLAEAGADVAVCDRVLDDGRLEAVAIEIRKLGRRSVAIQTDVTNEADVNQLVRSVTGQFGTIDILANCAGIGGVGVPMGESSAQEYDKFMDPNAKGTFLCCNAVAKVMLERKKGSILNIASLAAVRANSSSGAPYHMSKAAVVILTKVLARELGPHGIRVNCIAPGRIRTEMSAYSWEDPAQLEPFLAKVPLGRIAEVDDFKGPVLFLASEASNYITGHTLVLDGGQTA